MTELLTAAEMRAIEQAAIASGEVTGLELMERAGRGVVEAIFAEWPELAPPPGALPRTPGYFDQDEGCGAAGALRAVVLCGPGNNGGDGFVVARLLKAWGWEVEVFLSGDPDRMPPDARVNLERWSAIGEVVPLSADRVSVGASADLCVDALFGTGLARPVAPDLVASVRALAEARLGGAPVVTVDICTGLCADSGRVLGPEGGQLPPVLRPDLTVSFHRAKVGHFLDEGPRWSGRLVVVDIGVRAGQAGEGPPVSAVAAAPAALGKGGAHKYSHGHALILSGPSGRGGAARLAARGALRIGAGVVTVGCPVAAIPENAARLDAVMLREVADGAALQGVLEDGRINALCLGPGMGRDGRARELVEAALGRGGHPRALVLDADALTILSQGPDLFAALHDRCVLTPHGGEFARLFPDLAERLAAPAPRGPAFSKVDAAREAAARAGCVVLYKGPDTVIAEPSGRCDIQGACYGRAAPWLATAGSGDVLAGFICGLLARGEAPFEAACTGAWLHVECALSFGPGLIAEDLADELPKVLRALRV